MKAERSSKARRTHIDTVRWKRIFGAMDEAFGDYEQGLVALRKRVLAALNLKLRAIGRLGEKTTSGGARRS